MVCKVVKQPRPRLVRLRSNYAVVPPMVGLPKEDLRRKFKEAVRK